MSEIIVKDKEVVIPGQVLATGMDYLPANGTLREKDNIISLQVGLVNLSGRLIKVIPLTGPYIPKKEDVVIGEVADITLNGWRIDIGCAYQANLMVRDAVAEFVERGSDLTAYHNYGDYVIAKITNISGAKFMDLTLKGPGLRKLTEGKIIKIIPSKVPRVIGKKGSMISMIKDKTNTKILVGQNGLVWISGIEPKDEIRAIAAIKMIDEQSQTEGLTEKIEKFLSGGKNDVQKKK